MFEKIKSAICEYVEVEESEITENSRFIEDLRFTSYDFVSLLGELEDTYGIVVDEQEILKLRTVGDVVIYLSTLCKENEE